MIVRNVGAGCGGRGSVLRATGWQVGPTGRGQATYPQTTVAKEPGHRGERDISRKTIACGNAGRFRCTRCYSCAFHQYKVHTRPRVQRAPGIPHALQGGETTMHTSGASRRGNATLRLMNSCAPHFQPSSPAAGSAHCAANDRLQRAIQYSETSLMESKTST